MTRLGCLVAVALVALLFVLGAIVPWIAQRLGGIL